ncbi:MAG TPA: ferrous iron transport protein A [Polyangiaceae bacterium]|nr:ferrous iron transport protein A [Polyangiaceae bacterium]
MNLLDLELSQRARIESISGERAFRRRLFELGLVPGTEVSVVRVAPLGDPLELEARGSRLSIRRKEALEVHVVLADAAPAASKGDS